MGRYRVKKGNRGRRRDETGGLTEVKFGTKDTKSQNSK